MFYISQHLFSHQLPTCRETCPVRLVSISFLIFDYDTWPFANDLFAPGWITFHFPALPIWHRLPRRSQRIQRQNGVVSLVMFFPSHQKILRDDDSGHFTIIVTYTFSTEQEPTVLDEYQYFCFDIRYPQQYQQAPCLRPFMKLEFIEPEYVRWKSRY